MKVLKFGGSSVATPERIQGIVEILKKYYVKGEKFTVVFSAFGGVTDQLIEMATLAEQGGKEYQTVFDAFAERHQSAIKDLLHSDLQKWTLNKIDKKHKALSNLLYGVSLIREVSPRTMDYILSFGERSSAFIIAQVLKQEGIQAAFLDARKIIRTNQDFGSAIVDFGVTYQNIFNFYSQCTDIQIVTGFVGATEEHLTTTLGRGGSDYTAAILAAGLDAGHIEIWTDVDGVLTADPRKVKRAFTIPSMTYAEAMEMSHFGAKVIYPPTLQPALQKAIPIYIKNTFKPDFKGTYISTERDTKGHAVKGISSIAEVALLTLSGSGLFGVPGIAARLFNGLAQAGINIILITQGSSENSISFAVKPEFASRAKQKVEQVFEFELSKALVNDIKVESDLSVVAIVGENMRYRPGIAGRLFQALGKNGINAVAIAQGSSELNISVVIPRKDETKSLNALHEAFFLSDTKQLHVFMVGVGLIGSTLIEQIKKQNEFLKVKRGLEIKVVGLSNSKKMVFNEEGIDLENWKKTLAKSDRKAELSEFISTIKYFNLANTIFVDNTASDKVSSFYENILENSISISTPNKIATSSSYLQYQRLKTIAQKRGVQFLYETNVGAGLPVLTTLNDLIDSGDEILKIEGVLSGSLSFIFNTFSVDNRFSEVVRQAAEKGFTEPDPRIDLNGVDVRRKIIILAREAGIPLEAKDVIIENILSEPLQKAESTKAFFELLPSFDGHLESLRKEAADENKKLRMVASLDNGVAKIKLEKVDSEHPFYSLSGSDNMIVFTTQRYKERPLVIRGPGAGAEVTAAGVFAEIITIGNQLVS